MTVVHHGCGGHVVDGTCKACGKSTDGQRRVPGSALEALQRAREALRSAPTPDGGCLVQGRMSLREYERLVDVCECPVHAVSS